MGVVLAPTGNLAVPPSAFFAFLRSLRALATQRLGQFTLLGRDGIAPVRPDLGQALQCAANPMVFPAR
jgi:hypothetical protein